jgi:hypothetical protein
MMIVIKSLIILVFTAASYGLNNGLGRTPQMGKFEYQIVYQKYDEILYI